MPIQKLKQNKLINGLSLIALTITFSVILVLLWSSDEPTPDSTPLSSMEEPDAYLTSGTYREFSKNGELNSRMTVKEGIHFPLSEEGVFSSPDLLLYQNDRTPWTIQANRGQYLTKEEKLLLNGNVLIRQAKNGKPAVDFVTDELTLFTKSKFITTDKPVKIISTTGTMQATGMKVWVDDKKVQLLSNVEGTYVLNPN